MFEGYNKSDLEIWIEKKYKEKGICSPSDLEIDSIANAFNIEITISKGPERAIWDDDHEIYMIFLKPFQDEQNKREIFFHELCHPLRHYGNQELMEDNNMRDLQEEQAHLFQLYAAMPFFMFENLDNLPNSESELIEELSVMFNVPLTLATKRVKQITRRIKQGQLDKQFVELVNNEKVFNYCKNIEPRKFSKAAEDMMALAIQMKLSKKGVGV